MGFLGAVYLVIIAIHCVVSENENNSIKTSDNVPTIIEDELAAIEKRFEDDEYGETGDITAMMFTRGTKSPRIKWGKGDYTIKQQKQIVEAHNAYRKGVTPSSSDMTEIVWSPQLAEQAQEWSNRCFYEHPDKSEHPEYQGIGQNLYIMSSDEGRPNPPPVTDPVDNWYHEVRDFHFEENVCNPDAQCGHYTQVVWANTTKVGCGITFCSLARKQALTYKNAWLVTCNYSPGGNVRVKLPGGNIKKLSPYKSGEPCSQCEKGFCLNNLCSKCKPPETGCECNIECKNSGQLKADKCTCSCAVGFHGPFCEEICEDKHEWCGANPGWPKNLCKDEGKYFYVKDYCPALCGACTPDPRGA